ncbi:putative cytosolic ca2+-dependent cysteine protease calpain [Fasciola hepatica]|uniref:Cytosolic ca2+-dependent cysteine protease calpain n=1 Tax=Fasciola hepatica TaxID=6192 RepID=A0A4E0R767_FASHE|nr:putative cytosolic ca2+-dependent cysteine protease calpain [Fasciola hepatica]
MADPRALETDAANFAETAEKYQALGEREGAIFFFTEAAQAFLNALSAGSKTPDLRLKAKSYLEKAEALKNSAGRSSDHSTHPSNECDVGLFQVSLSPQASLERARYMLKEALDSEECGNEEEAVELYSNAVELLLSLNAVSVGAGNARLRVPGSQVHSTGRESPAASSTSSGGYTAEELKVLRSTSNINGREYLPFLDSIDLRERFAFPKPYTDKDGLLTLSCKQKLQLDRWVRPSDYLERPQMIMAISCFSIRQTVVTDCSFVASMAIAAQYERRFKKRLITNIIYPHQQNGEAVYNPCGMYMVRLNINGVSRKVVIDDYLPMGRNGELLCSYSSNRNELWVSLLEKAYMKVMGGYDFPGSNSNIDLHALTGWIPERISIRSGSVHFNKDKEFRRLSNRFHRGHCLVTVATGPMPEEEANRAGLVPTHAYAMLDIREVEGKRLLLLKNPWSHLRWRGNFSESDSRNWTPSLEAQLNYDRSSAQSMDNGVFWIDYDSLCHYFDVFYVNWNPDLFQHTTCVHDSWLAGEGPKKDSYSSANNPQYSLEVRSTVETPIWILLTRHITDKADFADNKEFIAVVVYKNIETRKVYYPYDPEPYRDSVRINSPHCLVQLLQEAGTVNYTLVISQYEKSNTIRYTLRVYSTAPFVLRKIIDPYKVEKQIASQWKGVNAAGCRNNPETYENNPRFQINMPNNEPDNQLLIELRGPKDYAIGCELIKVSATNPNAPNLLDRKSTGDYRRGYVVMEQSGLSGGVYNLIVSTYRPQQEGPFILSIKSLRQFSVKQIN